LFRGAHSLNLDTKGRVAIPVKIRQMLQDRCAGQLVVTVDRDDPALLVYPLPEWEVIEEELTRLPSLQEDARILQRMLIGHATDCELDGHGRILLPSTLREYASIDKHVILVGQGKKFELWNEQIWAERRDGWRAKGKEGRELSAQLGALSF
jgi:MraZ protein